MRQVVVHAALLVLALAFAYQTWTRDDMPPPGRDSVLLWSGDPEDVTGIVYESPVRRVLVEPRRDDTGPYLWVTVTLTDTTGTRTDSVIEFPGDDQAAELMATFAALRAVRDLGDVEGGRAEEFGLAESRATLTIDVGGAAHQLRVGGTVFASGDRYVEDVDRGRVYVIPASTVSFLESAEGVLVERGIHPPILERVVAVTVQTERGERRMQRGERTAGGPAGWVDPDAPSRSNPSFATFMERVEQLSVVSFAPNLDRSTLRRLATVEYTDRDGRRLDRLELFRSDAGGEPVYFVATDHTRVPGRVYSGLAEPIDQDLAQLF